MFSFTPLPPLPPPAQGLKLIKIKITVIFHILAVGWLQLQHFFGCFGVTHKTIPNCIPLCIFSQSFRLSSFFHPLCMWNISWFSQPWYESKIWCCPWCFSISLYCYCWWISEGWRPLLLNVRRRRAPGVSPFYWSSVCLSHCFSSTAFHLVAWCRGIRSGSGEEQLVENRKGWKEERERRRRKGKRTD